MYVFIYYIMIAPAPINTIVLTSQKVTVSLYKWSRLQK